MNFTFDDDQQALRDSVRRFLDERFPIERVVEIADGDGWDPAWWAEVAELGWTGISVPEDAGGAGLGFLEEIVVAEELGRGLFPGPWFSTVALALSALSAAPDRLEEVVAGKRAATLAWTGRSGPLDEEEPSISASEGGGRWRLTGTATFVPDLGSAELVVAVAGHADGPGVFVVERDGEGSSVSALGSVDPTRPLGAIGLEGAEARVLAAPGEAADTLEAIRVRALTALAAEAAGVADRALELAVEHAKSREQFGRAIGSFQAVSHSLADGFVELESARSLTYWAAWAVAAGAPEAPVAATAAKAYASEAAVRTCERAIQAHGGVGFTWEHPLHRFYRRALWIAAFMGWPAEHRARIASSLLD